MYDKAIEILEAAESHVRFSYLNSCYQIEKRAGNDEAARPGAPDARKRFSVLVYGGAEP